MTVTVAVVIEDVATATVIDDTVDTRIANPSFPEDLTIRDRAIESIVENTEARATPGNLLLENGPV